LEKTAVLVKQRRSYDSGFNNSGNEQRTTLARMKVFL